MMQAVPRGIQKTHLAALLPFGFANVDIGYGETGNPLVIVRLDCRRTRSKREHAGDHGVSGLVIGRRLAMWVPALGYFDHIVDSVVDRILCRLCCDVIRSIKPGSVSHVASIAEHVP